MKLLCNYTRLSRWCIRKEMERGQSVGWEKLLHRPNKRENCVIIVITSRRNSVRFLRDDATSATSQNQKIFFGFLLPVITVITPRRKLVRFLRDRATNATFTTLLHSSTSDQRKKKRKKEAKRILYLYSTCYRQLHHSIDPSMRGDTPSNIKFEGVIKKKEKKGIHPHRLLSYPLDHGIHTS